MAKAIAGKVVVFALRRKMKDGLTAGAESLKRLGGRRKNEGAKKGRFINI